MVGGAVVGGGGGAVVVVVTVVVVVLVEVVVVVRLTVVVVESSTLITSGFSAPLPQPASNSPAITAPTKVLRISRSPLLGARCTDPPEL